MLPTLSERTTPLFRVAGSINGLEVVGGNSARIMADSDASIDSMVADIDAATDHVHLVFYIWLTDNNGRKMADALMRAARRGVVCRALVDDLGSRGLIKSELWTQMRDAGVRLATSLTIGPLLLKPRHGRIDLRDHLLWQPELRRRVVSCESEVRPVGGHHLPFRRTGRAPESVPLRA